MHFAVVCVILSLGLFFCIMGAEGTRCNTACTRDYNPVCGHLQLHTGRKIQCTFGNSCMLHARACLTNESKLETNV